MIRSWFQYFISLIGSVIYFLGSSVFGHMISMDMIHDSLSPVTCSCEHRHISEKKSSQHSQCLSLEDGKVSLTVLHSIDFEGSHIIIPSHYEIQNNHHNIDTTIQSLALYQRHHPPDQKYLSYTDLIGISILLS